MTLINMTITTAIDTEYIRQFKTIQTKHKHTQYTSEILQEHQFNLVTLGV